MKKSLLFLMVIFTASASFAQLAIGDYRSLTSGNWSTASTWQIKTAVSGGWTTATVAPGASDNVYLQSTHTVTLTANAACKDFNISSNTTGTRLALGTNTLSINGKMRNFTQSSQTTSATDGNVPGTSNTTLPITAVWITSTTGKISIVGTTRTLTAATDWGAGNAGTASPNGFDLELNLTSGNTVTLNTSMKARTFNIVVGTLAIVGANRLGPDQGAATNSNFTIQSGATVTSEGTGTGGSAVIGRTGSGIGGILDIKSGAILKLTGTAPTIAMTTITNNGTVEYNAVGAQTLAAATNSGASMPSYINLIISGSGVKTAAVATTISGTTTINSGCTYGTGAFTTTNTGTMNIIGTFRIDQGGFANGAGIYDYGSTGTLAYNLSSGTYGPIDVGHTYWPASNGPVNVTVTCTGTGAINLGVNRSVPSSGTTGTFLLVSGTNAIQGNALTLNGIIQINGGNFQSSPNYGSSSTLIYNVASYSRANEWVNTSGAGYPNNVQIGNGINTTFNLVNGANSYKQISGNLTVSTGSSFIIGGLTAGSGGLGMAALGNIINDGTITLNGGTNQRLKAVNFVNGNSNSTATTTLSATGGGDLEVTGNFTDNGTFTSNARAVFFTGTSTQDITGTATAPFNIDYIVLNKASGSVRLLVDMLTGAPNTGNAITLTNTTDIFDLNGRTLTLGTAALASTISGNGSFRSSNTSGIVINGTGAFGTVRFDQTTPGITNEIKNFTVNRTSSGSVTLGNTLNITGGASANNEGTLTVSNGVLNTGGFLAIKSSANGTARIAPGNTAGGYISGDVSVERYIPQNSSKAWRVLASNTSGQTINAAWQEGVIGAMSDPAPGFGTKITGRTATFGTLGAAQAAGFDTLSPAVSLFRYLPATDALDPMAATNSGNIAAEQGYFIFIRGDRSPGQFGAGAPTTATVLRSKGSLFLGDQPAVSTGTSNFGLVRNPYPSRIDMRDIVRGGSLTNAYQIWDAKLGGAAGVGGFQTFTWDGTDYIVTPGGGSFVPNSAQNFIESGVAFFIQSSGGSGTAQVTEASKEASSTLDNLRPATGQAVEPRLSFTLNAVTTASTDVVDGGLVYFSNEFNNEVNIEDVRKSGNFNENFGTRRDNIDLVVERRAAINQNDTIFFNMNQLKQIQYRLDLEAVNFDGIITSAILQDSYTNTNTPVDLTVPNSYTFTVDANAASRVANRFMLVFRQSVVVPVSFISVRAAQLAGNISVEWKVENEVNTVRYEVEKSADGRSFTKKGSVIAAGSSTYSWLDVNVSNGYNYYRIKSVDNNGQVKYTQVVKVQVGGKAGISVSPNPIQGNFVNIQFAAQSAGKYGIRLTNIAGQAVYNRQVMHNGGSASQSFVLPSSLTSGVYHLEVINPANERHIEKLIINSDK